MKAPKEFQLRVRVSGDQRTRLDRFAQERGKGETVSALVRVSIDHLLNGPAEGGIHLSARCKEFLKCLSADSGRPLDQVLEECVEGIFRLLDDDTSPLIVEEIKLRRTYAGKTSAKIDCSR